MKKYPRWALYALAPVAVAAAVLSNPLVANSDDGSSDAALPDVASSAWQQLEDQSGVVVAAFDPKVPSIYRSSATETRDENVGQAISLEAAQKVVEETVGLTGVPSAASPVLVTTNKYGYTAKDPISDPSVAPMYEHAGAWALEYDDLTIPVVNRRAGTDSTYTTSMVFLVDIYTGRFIEGAQYDPPKAR